MWLPTRLAKKTSQPDSSSATHLRRHRRGAVAAGGQPCCDSSRTCSARRTARPPAIPQIRNEDVVRTRHSVHSVKFHHCSHRCCCHVRITPSLHVSNAVCSVESHKAGSPSEKQACRTWKHSQYFFMQWLFLQLQPRRCWPPSAASASICGRPGRDRNGVGAFAKAPECSCMQSFQYHQQPHPPAAKPPAATDLLHKGIGVALLDCLALRPHHITAHTK